MESDHRHISRLSDKLYDNLMTLGHVRLNGDRKSRYPGIMNFSFQFIEGESLIMAMKNIAVSSGSACTSSSLEPSYVLRAIGLGPELAHTSIRLGIG
jgi:cysteine desulfurase